MDKRFFVFLALSMFVLVGSQAIFDQLYPPPEPIPQAVKNESTDSKSSDLAQPPQQSQEPQGLQQVQQPAEKEPEDSPRSQLTADSETVVAPADREPADSFESSSQSEVEKTDYPLRYLGLGSLDPESDARALVTLSTHGGSIVRLELNNPQYQDIQDKRSLRTWL